jgi:hypothetical protein
MSPKMMIFQKSNHTIASAKMMSAFSSSAKKRGNNPTVNVPRSTMVPKSRKGDAVAKPQPGSAPKRVAYNMDISSFYIRFDQ